MGGAESIDGQHRNRYDKLGELANDNQNVDEPIRFAGAERPSKVNTDPFHRPVRQGESGSQGRLVPLPQAFGGLTFQAACAPSHDGGRLLLPVSAVGHFVYRSSRTEVPPSLRIVV